VIDFIVYQFSIYFITLFGTSKILFLPRSMINRAGKLEANKKIT